MKYANEKNILILISFLKAFGIKKVIASPGSTNMTFVASMQNDSWFEIYSCVDERSAAYMAVGMASETGEPVVITCTEATASRNYMPAMTEAFYRKLPIIAITGTHGINAVGQLKAQVIDRSTVPNDIVKCSVELPTVKNKDDEWLCEFRCNKVLSEAFRNGGGPVHINLMSIFSQDYSITTLPEIRRIDRFTYKNELPAIGHDIHRVAIFAGASRTWDEELTQIVDRFCEIYNGVVFCNQVSGYRGKYRILFSLIASQPGINKQDYSADLIISIGELFGQESSIISNRVWRVNEDGEIRDIKRSLNAIIELDMKTFFTHYVGQRGANIANVDTSYYELCKSTYDMIYNQMPELPFSNPWIARTLGPVLPEHTGMYFAILNTLRSWNYFDTPKHCTSFSNVGGFGIDGGISAAFGAALTNPSKIYYCIVGDLSFFYDMNVLGNRHMCNNLRIIVINNGMGFEFKNYTHPAHVLGEKANNFVAAVGHFGNKSENIIKCYAQNLGFEYRSASSKMEFEENIDWLINTTDISAPYVFEIYTSEKDENQALKIIQSVVKDSRIFTVNNGKAIVKKVLGQGGINKIKSIISK